MQCTRYEQNRASHPLPVTADPHSSRIARAKMRVCGHHAVKMPCANVKASKQTSSRSALSETRHPPLQSNKGVELFPTGGGDSFQGLSKIPASRAPITGMHTGSRTARVVREATPGRQQHSTPRPPIGATPHGSATPRRMASKLAMPLSSAGLSRADTRQALARGGSSGGRAGLGEGAGGGWIESISNQANGASVTRMKTAPALKSDQDGGAAMILQPQRRVAVTRGGDRIGKGETRGTGGDEGGVFPRPPSLGGDLASRQGSFAASKHDGAGPLKHSRRLQHEPRPGTGPHSRRGSRMEHGSEESPNMRNSAPSGHISDSDGAMPLHSAESSDHLHHLIRRQSRAGSSRGHHPLARSPTHFELNLAHPTLKESTSFHSGEEALQFYENIHEHVLPDGSYRAEVLCRNQPRALPGKS